MIIHSHFVEENQSWMNFTTFLRSICYKINIHTTGNVFSNLSMVWISWRRGERLRNQNQIGSSSGIGNARRKNSMTFIVHSEILKEKQQQQQSSTPYTWSCLPQQTYLSDTVISFLFLYQLILLLLLLLLSSNFFIRFVTA